MVKSLTYKLHKEQNHGKKKKNQMQSKYEQLVQYSKQYNIYIKKMNSTVKI